MASLLFTLFFTWNGVEALTSTVSANSDTFLSNVNPSTNYGNAQEMYLSQRTETSCRWIIWPFWEECDTNNYLDWIVVAFPLDLTGKCFKYTDPATFTFRNTGYSNADELGVVKLNMDRLQANFPETTITYSNRNDYITSDASSLVYFSDAGNNNHAFQLPNIFLTQSPDPSVFNLRIVPDAPSNGFIATYYSSEGSVPPTLQMTYEVCVADSTCDPFQGCVCDNGFYDNNGVCSDIDDCSPDPCNGGICSDNGVNSYSCDCTGTGAVGVNCETDIDECAGNPCQFGGTCNNGINQYTCDCVAGYIGTNCETDEDNCDPNPLGNCVNANSCTDKVNDYVCDCQNNWSGKDCDIAVTGCTGTICNDGTCSGGVNFVCDCAGTGFTGTYCEINIDDCIAVNCNAGFCVDGINSATCNCDNTGYEGANCDIEINECTGNTQCQNGATCVDGVNGFTCSCVNGYSGLYCDIDIDECVPNLCQFGGTCIDGVNGFTCQCETGRTGTLCTEDIECGSETFDNAEWDATIAGQEGSGSCVETWSGTPTRSCQQSGVTGIWSTMVTNPCTALKCPFTVGSAQNWTETAAGTFGQGICNEGYLGVANRSCGVDGFWSDLVSECDFVQCPAESYLNGDFPSSPRDTLITANCESGYAGTLSRFCYLNGTWDDDITGTCIASAHTCPLAEYANALWSPTTSDSTAIGFCLQGYGLASGETTRYCDFNQTHPGNLIGEWSSVVNNGCVEYADIPTGLQADRFSTSCDVSWDASKKRAPAATGYEVTISLDGTNFFATNNGAGANVMDTQFTVVDLQVYTIYYVLVKSINGAGIAPNGAQIAFRTHLAPVANLAASSISQYSLTLSWDAATLAEWYHVRQRLSGSNDSFVDVQSTLVDGFQYRDGTEILIVDLEYETEYEFVLFSGLGADYSEPYGSTIIASTIPNATTTPEPPTTEQQQSQDWIPIVVGAVAGLLFVVLCILLIFAVVWWRGRNRIKDNISLNSSTYSMSGMSLNAPGGLLATSSAGNLPPNYSVFSSASHAPDATLMNTVMEIAVPGFLHLDYETQLRIEDKIGGGGAALVFKGSLLDGALQEQHGINFVALKEIAYVDKLTAEENKERFLQEVSVMWSVSFHENVITLIGYTENPQYIVTKLYETDLFKLVHNPNFPITVPQAMKMCSDISNGMTAIQNMGIIHRDLKSANVLIERKAVPQMGGIEILNAVLCDFGLARIYSSVRLENQKFHAAAGMSPRYTAPEVFARAHIPDFVPHPDEEKKIDVYSFAIIIWELLSRDMPWGKMEAQQIEVAVRSEQRPDIPAHDANDQMALLVVELMKQCWHHDPAKRPYFRDVSQKLTMLIQRN